MKNIYPIIFIFFFFGKNVHAQSKTDVSRFICIDFNGSTVSDSEVKKANEQYQQQMLSYDPEWNNKRAAYEQTVQNFIANKKTNSQVKNVITIPVVVHIIYNTPIQNIPDSQVYSQLVVMNEDFMRANADTVNTPAPFAAVAGNPGIQFCLAQQDPNGLPTTGIERRYTTIPMFTGFDHPQTYSGGGLDQWDPTRYFNIWVCNSIYLGKGEFPVATTTPTYGLLVTYSSFGSNHTVYGTFPSLTSDDRGRIAVHEIGHCFNLYHIWGDDTYACSGTDFCGDTPNQAGSTSFGCPGPFPQFDSCSPNGNGIMFENYMDYTADSCQNLFTLDQCARMNAVLSIPPYNALATSNACQPPPTGINELTQVATVVFPNPFVSFVTISLPKEFKNTQFKLTDLLGNEIRSINFSGKQVIFQREGLSSGIYFYRICAEGRTVSSGKLIAE